MYFLTVCLNPTLQKTIILNDLQENEVNRSSEYYFDASGKGINVSRVLAQSGERTIHLTQAGGVYLDRFVSLANKDGITVEPVESYSEIRFCYTLLNRRNHTATEIVEESLAVEAKTETRVMRKFRQLLPDCHTVILSGSRAEGFSDEIYPGMVREAKAAGKRIICDFRGKDLKNVLPLGPDVVKPNFSEFCSTFLADRAVGEQTDDPETIALVKETMTGLYNKYGVTPVITRGRYDILFVENGRIDSLPSKELTPVNTIGCGDAFTAGFASVLHAGGSISTCVEKGRDYAAVNAMLIKPGSIQ
ncbi:MAG: hypothetical protein JW863_19905 [Chitinispirillaceae bacterium]|nr:hypothetical protein [Chitinispirillaceae bacterium]